jgi:hypothetical protein
MNNLDFDNMTIDQLTVALRVSARKKETKNVKKRKLE